MTASVSGAAVAQLTADPVPTSIGQPDAAVAKEFPATDSALTPTPLAFGD